MVKYDNPTANLRNEPKIIHLRPPPPVSRSIPQDGKTNEQHMLPKRLLLYAPHRVPDTTQENVFWSTETGWCSFPQRQRQARQIQPNTRSRYIENLSLRQERPPRLLGFFESSHGDGDARRVKRHPRARSLEKPRETSRAVAPPQSVHHATVRRCSSGGHWPGRSSSRAPLHLKKQKNVGQRAGKVGVVGLAWLTLPFCLLNESVIRMSTSSASRKR